MADKIEDLASRLVAARRTGSKLAALPEALVPATAAETYAVQDAVLHRLGATIGGWKVGASGPEAEPNCAPLFADLVVPSPARLPAARFPLCGIEGEIAFRMGRALPPRAAPYGEAEVWDAVATLHIGIELVDSRYAEMKGTPRLALLADNQANGAYIHGPAVHEWRAVDFLRQPVSLTFDGREVASAVGGNAAGHPRRLVAWLANHVAGRSGGLRPGDLVTTGTHTGLTFAPPGTVVTVRFAGLGEATLMLTAD